MAILRRAVLAVPLALMTYFYKDNDLLGIAKVVDTTCGKVRGKSAISRDGRVFMEYLGIPYAQPPVGNLRFEPPQPPEPWEGVRDALSFGNQCLQVEFFTSKILGKEDCLFLNVYRPVVRETNDYFNAVGPRLLPVMVFLHGGYFMSGSANLYRAEYFMDEDVVLVTLNYRVGAFGFLNSGDHVLRGNQGIKDQLMALKWIQQNIRNFGGDPNQVTIFGASAGAASIQYHMLSPQSRGLFHRAISQSGTAIKTRSFMRYPKQQAIRLATKLGCPYDKSSAMALCLRSIDPLKIVQAQREYRGILLHPLAMYAPSIEGVIDKETFLSDEPLTLLRNGSSINHVPWLVGGNSEEGLVNTARIIRNRKLISEINKDWYDIAPRLLNFPDTERRDVTRELTTFYFGSANPAQLDFNWAFRNFTDLYTDRLYHTAMHISIRELARYQSERERAQAPIYAYYYSYRGAFSFSNLLLLTGQLPPIVDIGISLTTNWVHRLLSRSGMSRTSQLGVCHGDELLMLFHLGVLSNVHQKHPDYKMSHSMVKLWADFAYGVDHLTFRNVTLQQVKAHDFDIPFLKIDRASKIVSEPFADRARFGEALNLF